MRCGCSTCGPLDTAPDERNCAVPAPILRSRRSLRSSRSNHLFHIRARTAASRPLLRPEGAPQDSIGGAASRLLTARHLQPSTAPSGAEPVRDWLMDDLPPADRRKVGFDVGTV